MRKKRVLFVSEASYLSTGYATYSRNVLNYLFSTNKYDLAELSVYGNENDPRRSSIPWKNYPNVPLPDDEHANEVYRSHHANQFGAWRFERACLDFEPDIVLSIRDFWMDSFIYHSPFRRLFKLCWMPTVDGAPQNAEWIHQFAKADYVLTYSQWANKILEDQSGGNINLCGVASPAASEDFLPKSKPDARISLNLPRDANIIGTVMRNQRRKLFPVLLEAFSKYIHRNNLDNTYLYCHTSYPDGGWDLPELLNRYHIANKVFFSYVCTECDYVESSLFNDAKKVCSRCEKYASVPCNVGAGVNDSTLSNIYNSFDLYVQCANCLARDEEIFTNNGWVKIQDVKVGDLAWTDKNRWKRVSDTWVNLEKSKNSKMLEMCFHSDYETIKATEDHECPAYTKNEFTNKRSVREQLGGLLRNNKSFPKMGRYRIDELSSGDLIGYAINDEVYDKNIVLSTEFDGDRDIEVDTDFCKWLGLYVADGSANLNKSCGSIRVTSHTDETDCHNLCESVMCKFSDGGVKTYKYKNRNAVNKEIFNKRFVEYLRDHCGKLDYKQFPEWVMYLPLEKQKACLQGLFMGDGHLSERRGVKTSVFVTISKSMADQVKHILRRLRINFSARKVIRNNENDGKNRKPQYRFEINGDIANGEFLESRHNTRNFYHDNYHYIQIKNIEEIEYNDDVFCITVEDDHTMLTRGGVVYQCEGFGLPQVEAAACGIPIACTNYSAMEDVVHTLNAFPITVQAFYKELETGCERAVPSSESLIEIFTNFFQHTGEERHLLGMKTRSLYEQNYGWDKTSAVWEKVIDSCDYADWKSTPPVIKPMVDIDFNGMTNRDFIKACVSTYLIDQSRLHSHEMRCLLRDLNNGFYKPTPDGFFAQDMSPFVLNRGHTAPISKPDILKNFQQKLEISNIWESARMDRSKLRSESWLD